ncbi:hypothetical protein DNK56_23225 [Streptomyces sp. AC1-42W]|nr:hypothetical protein DNK56_23225 [Streptomyces sp. AC1-42W]
MTRRTPAGNHESHNRPATAALSSMCRHPAESRSCLAHTVRVGAESVTWRPGREVGRLAVVMGH